jgi:hypothetical protein
MPVQWLADLLRQLDLEFTEDDILDLLWLAPQIGAPAPAPSGHVAEEGAPDSRPSRQQGVRPSAEPTARLSIAETADSAPKLYLRRPVRDIGPTLGKEAVAVRAPGAPALVGQLNLARALRPLKQTVPSRHQMLVDEEATANRIADAGLWIPALQPAPTRWLELALVVDGYQSMSIWQETITELGGLLERLGAFRDIRFWILDHPPDDLSRPGVRRWQKGSPLRSPRELIDPAGDRVIIIISDCLGPMWQSQSAQEAIADWARHGPVAILQPLPQRLWSHCRARPVPARIRTLQPGAANRRLDCRPLTRAAIQASMRAGPNAVPVPVLELDSVWLASWSRMISASGTAGMDGMVIFLGNEAPPVADDSAEEEPPTPYRRVQRFRETASPEAFRLAECLAAAPISVPVIRLVQEVMLGTPKQSQLAEVFLGGLLGRLDADDATEPDEVQYDFLPGVRNVLIRGLRREDILHILLKVSQFVGARFGQARDFRALLAGADIAGDYLIGADSKPFAHVAEHVLRLLGGQYVEPAERLAAALADNQVRAEPGTVPVLSEESREKERARPSRASRLDNIGTDAFEGALAQVSFADRRSRQRPLSCPYCYHAFAEREILFRCSGRAAAGGAPCERQVDTTLLTKMRLSALLPPVFAGDGRKDEAVCPDCHWPTRTQVCPGCHSHLPATFRAAQGRLIALVGPSEAGKTAFMTVLIHELRHQAGERLNSSTIGADDTTQERFTRDYEWPLYKRSLLFSRTTTAEQDYVTPLVFRFTMDQRTRFRVHQKELLLSFADSAGEDLVSFAKIELMAHYLAAADAVMVLIDPLQFQSVRDLLAPGTPMPHRAQQEEGPTATVDRITRLLAAGSASALIEKPVAVVLTKLDTLWPVLPHDSALRAPGPDIPFFDASDSAAVQSEIRELLQRWSAAALDRIVQQHYARFQYFAVSALGAAPTAENRIPDQGIRPYRVTDPFMWLLSQFGLVESQ